MRPVCLKPWVILTVAPHVTLMSEFSLQNWFQGHPFNRDLETWRHHLKWGNRTKEDISSADPPGAAAMSYLPSVGVVLGLVYIEQTGQAEVGDLHMAWVLNQDIAGSQIPVHQPDLLQITHPLHTHTSISHEPCVHTRDDIKWNSSNQSNHPSKKDETLCVLYKPWRSGHTSWGGTGSRCGPCSPWCSRGGSRTASAEWPAAPWRSDRSPADDTHKGWPHLPSHTPPGGRQRRERERFGAVVMSTPESLHLSWTHVKDFFIGLWWGVLS